MCKKNVSLYAFLFVSGAAHQRNCGSVPCVGMMTWLENRLRAPAKTRHPIMVYGIQALWKQQHNISLRQCRRTWRVQEMFTPAKKLHVWNLPLRCTLVTTGVQQVPTRKRILCRQNLPNSENCFPQSNLITKNKTFWNFLVLRILTELSTKQYLGPHDYTEPSSGIRKTMAPKAAVQVTQVAVQLTRRHQPFCATGQQEIMAVTPIPIWLSSR